MALIATLTNIANPGGSAQPGPSIAATAENTGLPLPQPTRFLGLFTLALYQRCPELSKQAHPREEKFIAAM